MLFAGVRVALRPFVAWGRRRGQAAKRLRVSSNSALAAEKSAWPVCLCRDALPKAAQTCLIHHHKSTSGYVRSRAAGGRRSRHDHHDASLGSGGSGTPRRHRGGAARDRAGGGRDRQAGRNGPLRVRWPDGLPSTADGRGASGHHRTGFAGSEILLRAGHQGGAARLRYLAVRRRAAAGRWRAARPRQIQTITTTAWW
jgi:hypothetical protein